MEGGVDRVGFALHHALHDGGCDFLVYHEDNDTLIVEASTPGSP